MRGTPPALRGHVGKVRIIPAHAGNSPSGGACFAFSADHPRACGELDRIRRKVGTRTGSSPRMRGTLPRDLLAPRRIRIIPAHAGNSWKRRSVNPSSTDHPRACGELGLINNRLVSNERIIPAHAGNSSAWLGCRFGSTDHPRACGELDSQPRLSTITPGSSPRMRGTRPLGFDLVERFRIIPAHAGNSPWGRA